MRRKLRRLKLAGLGILSMSLTWQSTCPLESDFDPVLLFANAVSTVLTDTLFFALDSYLVTIS